MMDTVGDLLVQEGIVKDEVLASIRDKTKGRSMIVEIYNSMEVDEDKIVDIFSNRLKFKRADLSDIMPDALG
ncbi:MAG: hypothetical protein HZA17_00470 [Nitrospirae bacterium]|nr:hypothetical protein [Nitrospirota bacterium]